MSDKLILITGATGKQGGATLRHLAKRGGFRLRAFTRKPDGEAARAVAALGAEVVAGDLDDAASVERALAGAWGVFAVQNSWEAGVEKEEVQGKRLTSLARAAGVQHFVQSSVGSAHLRTGIPHFESKWHIEEAVRAARFPSHVILRPVYFMENLLAPWTVQGDKLPTPLGAGTKVQMVAVDDIGKFGAAAFADAERMKGVEVDIAGDAVTMPEAAAGLSQLQGKPIAYQQIPMEAVRANSVDLALMLEWFEGTGYSADIPSLEKRFGIRPLTFGEWLRARKA
jgi:uncharacterized protein YbjT (DUF2867 family)